MLIGLELARLQSLPNYSYLFKLSGLLLDLIAAFSSWIESFLAYLESMAHQWRLAFTIFAFSFGPQ